MRIPTQLGAVISGTATLAMLAGCSGGGAGTPVANQVSQQSVGGVHAMSVGHKFSGGFSVLRPGMQQLHLNNNIAEFVSDDAAKKGGATIFVSDAANNVVDIFSSAGKLTGTLTGFSEPQGLSSDKAGNLYVADTGNSEIKVYAKGYKGKPKVLSDPGEYPAAVDVDSNGNIAATNIISTSGGAGSVSFYAKGKSSPTKTVSGGLSEVYFCAFDKAGNLYIDGDNASTGDPAVAEIVGGLKGKSITVLSTSNTIEFPGGVQVTTGDKPTFGDQEGYAVYTYNAPKKGSLGAPIATTPLTGASDPVSYALTSTDKDLYTADAGLASALEYAYPKGGSAVSTIAVPNSSEPIGVALVPDELP